MEAEFTGAMCAAPEVVNKLASDVVHAGPMMTIVGRGEQVACVFADTWN